MDKNHLIQPFFNKIELPLDDLEQLLSIQELSQSMTRYRVLNFSLCVPKLFNVMINTDGYDFIAYHPIYSYDYHVSPIIMTVSHQNLGDLQLGSDLNQFTFLELILTCLQSPLKFLHVEEMTIDGYEAVKVSQDALHLGKQQTTYLWLVNQKLIQVSISFNEINELSQELTDFFIQSFKVNDVNSEENIQLLKHLEQFRYEAEKDELIQQVKRTDSLQVQMSPRNINPESLTSKCDLDFYGTPQTIRIVWNEEETSLQDLLKTTEVGAASKLMAIHRNKEKENQLIDAQKKMKEAKTFSLNDWLQVVEKMSTQLTAETKIAKVDSIQDAGSEPDSSPKNSF